MIKLSFLLKKDLKNTFGAMGPAALLGVPLLFVLQWQTDQRPSWSTGFWTVYFFSLTALFLRSFGAENRYHIFGLYKNLKVSRPMVFWSQVFLNFLASIVLGVLYSLLVILFWSPENFNFGNHLLWITLVGISLSPLSTLLGLMLHHEREFLFSVVYFPLSTPVILAAYALTDAYQASWLYLLLTFSVVSAFVSAAFFELFFDDLTQSRS